MKLSKLLLSACVAFLVSWFGSCRTEVLFCPAGEKIILEDADAYQVTIPGTPWDHHPVIVQLFPLDYSITSGILSDPSRKGYLMTLSDSLNRNYSVHLGFYEEFIICENAMYGGVPSSHEILFHTPDHDGKTASFRLGPPDKESFIPNELQEISDNVGYMKEIEGNFYANMPRLYLILKYQI